MNFVINLYSQIGGHEMAYVVRLLKNGLDNTESWKFQAITIFYQENLL